MTAEFFYWYLVPFLFLISFLIAYRINRVNLITGFLLSCSVISFALMFCIQAYYSESFVLRLIFVLIMLFALFLLTFGVYIVIVFLVLNTRTVLKRESRSLKHCLTLIFAAGLIVLVVASHFVDVAVFPAYARYFIYSAYGLLTYYFLHLTQFILSTILCNFFGPRGEQDYIIVLGCQIRDGKVTPALANRLDKAIEFYNKQKKKGMSPKLVLSGGKGHDEICSEAEAMRIYALEKGIPDEKILLETRSKSTKENMEFSKELIDIDSDGKPSKVTYATSNYHLFRADIFAKRAGFKVGGVGAKTAFYYLPNAVLREYAAYLYIHMKWNLAFGATSLLLGSILLYNIAERFT